MACSTFAAVGIAFYGSLRDCLALASGHSVSARVDSIRQNLGSTGATLAVVSLKNLVPHEIKLLGSSSTCGCTMTEELPKKLKPFERRRIAVVVDPDSGARPISMKFITNILTEQPEARFEISR